MRGRSILALCVATWAGLSHAQAEEARRFALVLDASNSMWGQVNQRAKIDIARDVVGRLLKDWPENQPLGLVAYGHRKKQDCQDIERLIPVGPLDRDRMTETVKGLSPRGRTPLTAAVNQAAEALDYASSPATVILLSDGIESCDADPCAMAERLESTNADTTIHVVGFDVDAIEDKTQLQCLADKTGGLFVAAKSADELDDALRKLSGTKPRLGSDTASLEAPAETGAGSWVQISWTGPNGPDDRIVLVKRGAADSETGNGIATGKGNPLRLPTPHEAGDYELRYVAGANGAVLAREPLVLAAVKASLDAEDQFPAGGYVLVHWSGPENPKDRIVLVAKGSPPNTLGRSVYVDKGNPASLLAPDEAGDYELRYLSGQDTVLATREISVQPVEADLDVPDSTNSGGAVVVQWSGPNNHRDLITLVPKDSKDGTIGYKVSTAKGNPARLLAPEKPGEYEIRYVSGQSIRTLARAPVKVLAVDVALELVGDLYAGGDISIRWTGPNGVGDHIMVVDSGAKDGTRGRAVYTSKGNPITMRAPGVAGDYEARYVTGQSKSVLGRLAVSVLEPTGSLEAPDEAAAGGLLYVAWSGPNFLRDAIVLRVKGTPDGRPASQVLVKTGNPAGLRIPDTPGDYVLSYQSDKDKVLATRAVTVVAEKATLAAPTDITAGTEFTVSWSGPGGEKDMIALAEQGAPDDQRQSATPVAAAATVRVTAPDGKGSWELRYVDGENGKILARHAIVIR